MPGSTRSSTAVTTLLLGSLLAGCRESARDVCTFTGTAAAINKELTVEAKFALSTCEPADKRCSVTVEGMTINIDATATLCPGARNNPNAIAPKVTCTIPPLKDGTYTVEPFGKTLSTYLYALETSCTLP